MDEFSKNYDNIIFFGDFNTCINDNAMTSFCSLNDPTSLIDQPTCYRNPDKPTCIDLIHTNRPKYFKTMKQCLWNRPLRLSYYGYNRIKNRVLKRKPHIVAHRDYKHFDNEKFWSDIQSCASEKNHEMLKKNVFCIFNENVPIKSKHARAVSMSVKLFCRFYS